MLHRKFEIPVYDQSFHLVIYNTSEIPAALKKYKLDKDDLDGRALTTVSKDRFIIFINQEEDQSIGVHELIHLKNVLFQHLGIELSYDNDEHEANLIEFLFKKISRYIRPIEYKSRKKRNESI